MRLLDLRQSADLEIPRPDTGEEPVTYVRELIERVRKEGDGALVALAREFDGVELTPGRLRVTEEEIEVGLASISRDLRSALEEAASRIRKFAEHQVIGEWQDSVGGGVLGEVVQPVQRVGLYVPGGRAVYPSVVLMGAVPASVAGVESVAICVPPALDGGVPAPTLAAAALTGVNEIYRVGGPQAIAAMAFGTETIKRVNVIAGGGGLLVALAKREVAGSVAIDSVAGPSEIAIIADDSADSLAVACDLIAQAEHGPHGSFVLLTWEEELILEVQKQVAEQLDRVGASNDLRSALEEGLVIARVTGLDQALEAAALFAPEHLELICEDADALVAKVRNAGAIFLGPNSPVSLGDYLAGSNHTLPTMGAATWASGLRASLFQRASAVVKYDAKGLSESVRHVQAFAEAEGLPNHARALEVRVERRGK